MSKLYKGIISVADRFIPQYLRPLWDHPAVIKGHVIPEMETALILGVDFWNSFKLCPKYLTGPKDLFTDPRCFNGLVFASLGDVHRSPDTLSIPQCFSLAMTGFIWSRYSLVITPKNYSLFAVNMFVGAINTYQLGRAYIYQQSQK